MSFYVGQKVVCVDGGNWFHSNPKRRTSAGWIFKWTTSTVAANGPATNEVVTIVGFSHTGSGYLELLEYADGYYCPVYFRPIDPLHEALDAIEENHTVEPEPAFA